ncbi:MAG TPA: acyl-CoA dehydratase activase [bacterium]|nr:acyl-CoA dehydratase activase [bacterium]HPY14710.1 acyl-CoA dehydratase activase [bacterium]HQB09444.1 acyl-CoA dehydratase activase [bacterium]HQM84493.1 acyl-CoA dehydratase activase [bacterium]
MKLFCGIDIGSRTGKIVIINDIKEIVFSSTIETIAGATNTINKLSNSIPDEIKKNIVSKAVTGYGRESVFDPSTFTLTEITAHYLGVISLHPETRTVIDIGGQDSKVITIDNDSRIKDFVMNDRCAAGTGRFLEVMCGRIGLTLDEFTGFDVENTEPVKINSTCTVFAESEIVSLMSRDVPQPVIVSTLAIMAARNTFNMARKIHPEVPFFMSGGVSKIKPVKFHLQKLFKSDILTSGFSQIMGALGAAIFAMNKTDKK